MIDMLALFGPELAVIADRKDSLMNKGLRPKTECLLTISTAIRQKRFLDE